MSLGQIVIERKTALNRLLALLFASIGIFQACSASILSGFYQTLPFLSLAYLPTLGSIGPILYGIHQVSVERETESFGFLGLSKIHLFLPISLWAIYLFGIFISEEQIKAAIANFVSGPGIHISEIILFVPLTLLLGYVTAILAKSSDLFRPEILRQEWTTRILLFLVLATLCNLILGAVYLLTRNPLYLLANAAMMSCSLCLAYLIGHKRPEFFRALQEVALATRQKYARSLLQGLDRTALKENLLQVMEKERLYRDEELSLADLADELALSTHQVSELINQELGKNFAAFVNDFRIREACELLRKDPDRSVLDIAFEVGFRTKSSFHRAFQKHTGKTPSEYRGLASSNL